MVGVRAPAVLHYFMAYTVRQTVQKALKESQILEAGGSVEDEDLDDAIIELNVMMFEEVANGLNVGFSEVSDPEDYVTVPIWSYGWVSYTLGIRLCGLYGVDPPPTLIAKHDRATSAVEKMVVENPETYYPCILPTGWDSYGYYDRNAFFGDQGVNDILSGNNGNIRDEEGQNVENETKIETFLGNC